VSGITTMTMIGIGIVIRLDRIGSNSNYYRGCDGGDNGKVSSGGSNLIMVVVVVVFIIVQITIVQWQWPWQWQW